ncbi:serine/threonine-protein kinase [Catenuloplanes indicus]|uniref:non-specific serine/threonine protein kinase n=1 Tax=Catenuloplanes indicus TaxID=137267 RepID=A0AAE3VVG1_9ACTN|nr:serine/threonine-protein kinase [Catenuloplanes indicus]MDQ0364362.1 serine/threonine-protein kinase [Catenuloplanes indicus]
MLHGRLVGERYLLRDPLGNGGMSVVWRAEDTLLGREVAVKVLSADVAADPAALGRMYAEARAAASLRHDNVVEVYDYGETEIDGVPMPYVVMELVDGRPLSDLLTAGALPWPLAALIGAQVAAALAAAHDRGVVHRDVKPANVMVHSGGVKLVDFGISAAAGELEQASGEILGTPAYLAPERLAGGMVRPATDVYALGLLLYLMLAGRMPWNVSTTTQMLRAHRYRDPAPLPTVDGLPAETADLVRRCLSKAPSDRPAAVTAARILRRAAGLPALTLLSGLDRPDPTTVDTPTQAATPATSTHRTATPGRITGLPVRHRIAAGGALIASAAAAAAFVLWPAPEPVEAVADVAPLACRVTYTTQIAAEGQAVTAVTVTNTGSSAVDAWTLSFHLPADQKLLRGSDATWRQHGDLIEATGPDLAAGTAANASFDTTFDTSVALPQSFTVNDVSCTAEMSVRAPRTSAAASVPAVAQAPIVDGAAPAHGPAPAGDPAPADGGRGKGAAKQPAPGEHAGPGARKPAPAGPKAG